MVLTNKLSKNILILFFVAVVNVGVISMRFNFSSYALALLAPLAILFFFIIINLSNYYIKYDYLLIIIMILLILYLQLLISIYFYGLDGLNKSLLSLFILTIISLLAPVVYKMIVSVKDDFLIKVIYICYFFMLFIGFIALVMQKLGYIQAKSMIIFREPSHYAVAIFPFLFFVVRISKNKLFHLSLFLILTLLVHNVTMLVGFFLALLFSFKFRKTIFVVITLTFLFFFLSELSFFKFDYYKVRLLLDNSNISALVYLFGWETALRSFMDSYGLGVGFNRMGFVGPTGGKYREMLESVDLGELNIYDGGVTGAKLITETGITGVILLLIYLYYFIKVFKKFKNGVYKDSKSLFFSSVFLSTFIEYFVRGFGYFSPNIILFLTSSYWLSIKQGKNQ